MGGWARALLIGCVVLYFLVYLPFMFIQLSLWPFPGASGGWAIGAMWFAFPGVLLTLILAGKHAPKLMIGGLLVATIALSITLGVNRARFCAPDVDRLAAALEDVVPEEFGLRDEQSQGGSCNDIDFRPSVSNTYSSDLSVDDTLDVVGRALEQKGYEVDPVVRDVTYGTSPDDKLSFEVHAYLVREPSKSWERNATKLSVRVEGRGHEF